MTLGNEAPSQAGDDRLPGSRIECRAGRTLRRRHQRRNVSPTGNEARSTTGECAQRLRLERHGAATRPALEYTARVIPHHDAVAVPSESRTDPVAAMIPDRRGTGFGFSIPNHGNADQDPDNQTPVRIRGKDSIRKKIRLTKRTAPNVVTIVLSGCLRSYF